MEPATPILEGPPVLLIAVIILGALLALSGLALMARRRRGWPVGLVAAVVVALVTVLATALMLVTGRVLWLPDLSGTGPEGPVGAGLYIFGMNAVLALGLAILAALGTVRLARAGRG